MVELKYAVEESDRLTDKARRDLSRARELVESAARAGESCEVRQREHQRLRPTTEAGRCRATADRLADELSEAARKLHRAHQQVIAVQRHLAATYREDVEIRRELDKARTRLGRRPDLLALYQAALGQDELAAPWTDREWNTARTELFFEALRLHRAFLKAESARIRASLHGAMDVLLGESLVNASEEAIRAAWQTLFFVVPVVSTTFASFGSMFSHLPEESLGWVILDEAGQAAPQQAAGAIWRGRRVIALGDPFQLEPVVPLSIAAQQALRRTFGVEEERWLPGRTSVQHLADQRTAYGTYLPDEEAQVWVGASHGGAPTDTKRATPAPPTREERASPCSLRAAITGLLSPSSVSFVLKSELDSKTWLVGLANRRVRYGLDRLDISIQAVPGQDRLDRLTGGGRRRVRRRPDDDQDTG